MDRRVPRLALTVALVALAAPVRAAPRPPGTLVAYSFEEADLATGPDTFAAFENARGRVDLSTEIPFSGWASIRIEDAPGDGDFPELQGYFERRAEGELYVHFALLVAEADEPFNVALAGPEGFSLGPDGISFWMQLEQGALRHVSDSISRRLVDVRPFVWYGIDLTMHLGRGTYDLRIVEEGREEPIVDLHETPSAASAPRSAVDKFSFIGDLPGRDRSRTVYFVDDVLVGVDQALRQVPFAAPGRRTLFFDRCWKATLRAEVPAAPCPRPAARTPDEPRGLRFEEILRGGDARGALELADAVLIGGGLDDESAVAWRERAAAAAHFLGLDADAEAYLEEARARAPVRASILVALSDLAHLRGDLAAERELREAVYGSLALDRY